MRYDTEVMFHLSYGYSTGYFLNDTNILFISFSYIRAYNTYFDNYILFLLIVTLLIVIHNKCINCIDVREYHGYSLTANKSLS